MNIGEYQKLATRTYVDLPTAEENLVHMKVGFHTETCGEILDIFKRHFAYGKPLNLAHLREEIGDACWYLACMAHFHKIELDYEYNQEDYNGNGKSTSIQLSVYIMDDLIPNFNIGNYEDPMFYYLTFGALYAMSCELNIDFNLALELNIKKLQLRYPEKFDTEHALNRDLEKEKQILEK